MMRIFNETGNFFLSLFFGIFTELFELCKTNFQVLCQVFEINNLLGERILKPYYTLKESFSQVIRVVFHVKAYYITPYSCSIMSVVPFTRLSLVPTYLLILVARKLHKSPIRVYFGFNK